MFDPVTEGLHVTAILAVICTDEVVGTTRTQGEFEGRDQPSRAQVIVSQNIVRQQHAGAFNRGVERVIRAVEAEPASGIDPV
jgi:hypothetical protein